ncbi:MAG: hypothetical protein IPM52_09955 [Bacteroidetes bacterium]|nr:hypothetical protein [Bacteroidota bacterium]
MASTETITISKAAHQALLAELNMLRQELARHKDMVSEYDAMVVEPQAAQA